MWLINRFYETRGLRPSAFILRHPKLRQAQQGHATLYWCWSGTTWASRHDRRGRGHASLLARVISLASLGGLDVLCKSIWRTPTSAAYIVRLRWKASWQIRAHFSELFIRTYRLINMFSGLAIKKISSSKPIAQLFSADSRCMERRSSHEWVVGHVFMLRMMLLVLWRNCWETAYGGWLLTTCFLVFDGSA